MTPRGAGCQDSNEAGVRALGGAKTSQQSPDGASCETSSSRVIVSSIPSLWRMVSNFSVMSQGKCVCCHARASSHWGHEPTASTPLGRIRAGASDPAACQPQRRVRRWGRALPATFYKSSHTRGLTSMAAFTSEPRWPPTVEPWLGSHSLGGAAAVRAASHQWLPLHQPGLMSLVAGLLVCNTGSHAASQRLCTARSPRLVSWLVQELSRLQQPPQTTQASFVAL